MTSSLWYGNPINNNNLGISINSACVATLEPAHFGTSSVLIVKAPERIDPLIPGEMYKTECGGFGFTYMHKRMQTELEARTMQVMHSAVLYTTGGIRPRPETAGNLNTGDLVQYIGTYESRGNSFYKLIKRDEMGYVPVGSLALKHFTEKDLEPCHRHPSEEITL